MEKIDQVAAKLTRVGAICDTGYAFAIHIRYTRPSLLYRTYSKDWIDYYSEHGLMLTDPVVRWGLGNTGLMSWAALKSDDPAGVIASAQRFGLENGVSYSVGPVESRTLAGFTKSGAAFTDEELAELTMISNSLHDLTEGLDQFDPAVLDALRAL
ncbi:MAG: autoinducer binding domain-containing protein [Paracoccaceae bacterium]